MKNVFLVTFAVTTYAGIEDVAGLLITANEGADENGIAIDAAALLPTTTIRKINAIGVEQVNDETLRAIGLIALGKGLL